MDLVLWRHCEAAPGIPDDARPLTPRGLKQADAMARWLAGELPRACRILVSPALRARQTAQALDRAYEISADVGTGTDVDALLEAAGWPGAPETVLVVGHQPTLGQAVARLVGDGGEPSLPAGAACWLVSEPDGSATIRVIITPDLAASP
jgi:phosphohistidine phosphatase